TIAVAGSDAKDRKYIRTIIGASVSGLLGDVDDEETRIISGDVLTGAKVANDGYIGFYENTLTLIPEGKEFRMFGWLPFTYNGIPSVARTSFAWLFPNKKYEVNTNLHG